MRHLLIAFVALLAYAAPAMAAEETAHTTLTSATIEAGEVSLRRYPEKLVARVTVPATEDAGNSAFMQLAGYIFGDNTAAGRIAMTTPVTIARSTGPEAATDSAITPAAGSSTISMTTPVTEARENGKLTMTFFLPPEYTLENIPKPTDPAIRIETAPAQSYAAIRFSGFGRPATMEEKETALRQWLATQPGITPTAAPSLWVYYNPPWSLPFLRRNEVWLPVQSN